MRVIRIIFLIIGILLLTLAAAFQYSRSWQGAFFVEPLYQLDPNARVVALTFDDGPSAVRTLPLLDLLDSLEVKATFFMLGLKIEQHPSVAREVFERGHLIGNHSFDHPRMYFRSPAFMKDQILRTDSLIRSLGQPEVTYFRPPYSGKFIILPLLLSSLDKVLVTGTYDPPAEYERPYDGQKVAGQILENARPGMIVYLHDGHARDAEEFLKSVELTVTGLRERGFTFARVDHSN